MQCCGANSLLFSLGGPINSCSSSRRFFTWSITVPQLYLGIIRFRYKALLNGEFRSVQPTPFAANYIMNIYPVKYQRRIAFECDCHKL